MKKFIEKVVYEEFDQERLEEALREAIIERIDYDELAEAIADDHSCEIAEILSECIKSIF